MACKGETSCCPLTFCYQGTITGKLLSFKFMQMGMVAESTYFEIQDTYCIEPVDEFWQKITAGVLTRLQEKDEVLVLG